MASVASSLDPVRPLFLATATLPSTISFSSAEAPQLLVVLTPVNFQFPVTFNLQYTCFTHLANCLIIRNVKTGKPQYLPRIDVNWTSAALKHDRAEAKDFITIQPGESHVITTGFRPFGDQICSEERRRDMPKEEKWKFALSMGMHTLKIGETYEVGVVERLSIPLWITREEKYSLSDDDHEALPWFPTGPRIEVKPAPPTQFHVEA